MSRERLAAQQAALLRAVLVGEKAPPGFDADRVAVQAGALLAKRRRITAAIRPDLADVLGDGFGGLFSEYALAHPRRDGSRAREDADDFGRWLVERGHLSAPGKPWWRLRQPSPVDHPR
jgi:hypothetical protein